ncbi:DUF1501 domain-containing protein [Acidisphaera sp. L21]|uniref:DUF1501 domain-containing protein n=1 Tax=Acidisphaera sp. L21 TaxID=1641851 RepID=UPI00131B4F86|nr:DUF1501 domain-containing protein [Acidisphaera sp. L21]
MHPSFITRRSALLGLASAFTLGRASLALAAASTDARFVVVIMRGALDGLAAVVPYGDPALAALRGPLVPPPPGAEGGLADLGGFYGLHPSMPEMAAMYRAGELLPVHAVAGHYRSRSHFEAQDCMESGADHRMTSGWLNRAVLAMPKPPGPEAALAVGLTTPLLMQGPATIAAYAPPSFAKPDADLYARIAALNHADPITGPAIAEGMRDRGFSGATLMGTARQPNAYAFPALAAMAGKLLASPTGPRVAALELGGWDTHADQMRRLHGPLSALDQGLAALKLGLGDQWSRTAVLVMTEFGRTARINGTAGTDHGTGTVAFVAGGQVAGGRVMANWPGLGNLFEDRDLQPTADLRSVAKGLLGGHLGLPAAALASVFPGSSDARPTAGLLRV